MNTIEHKFTAIIGFDHDEDGYPAFVETGPWSKNRLEQIQKCVLPTRTLLSSKIDFSISSNLKDELNTKREYAFKDIIDAKTKELKSKPIGAKCAELKRNKLIRDFSDLHAKIVIPIEITLIIDCDSELWKPDINGNIAALTHEYTIVESSKIFGTKLAIKGKNFKIWPDVEIGKLKEVTKKYKSEIMPKRRHQMNIIADAYEKANQEKQDKVAVNE